MRTWELLKPKLICNKEPRSGSIKLSMGGGGTNRAAALAETRMVALEIAFQPDEINLLKSALDAFDQRLS